MNKVLTLIFLLSFPIFAVAQETEKDAWAQMKALIGEWRGTGGGEPGEGKYERSYKFIFDNKFIEIRNKSTYKPQPKNPKGEIHEDVGYISYDKMRKTFALRQFHKESFVNQYRLESVSPDGKEIVFVSESIENIPSGWRAKETYRFIGDNEFIETFELAAPGKDFEVYSKATLKRVKQKKSKGKL